MVIKAAWGIAKCDACSKPIYMNDTVIRMRNKDIICDNPKCVEQYLRENFHARKMSAIEAVNE